VPQLGRRESDGLRHGARRDASKGRQLPRLLQGAGVEFGRIDVLLHAGLEAGLRVGQEHGDLLQPALGGWVLRPGKRLERMQHGEAQVRLHGAELAAAHVFDLFNDALPIQVVHQLAAPPPAQALGLGFAPAEGAGAVVAVGHGGSLRPAG
jgi:hypothetical protein